jgi:protein-arginine kinase activator protein McsA
MNINIAILTRVFLNPGVEIDFDQKLEVSLDCSQCSRTHRTVVFDAEGEHGRCTPTGHEFVGHAAKAQVQSKAGLSQREVECLFLLSYEYSPVKDSKYPGRTSNAIPDWGRVHFKLACPKCNATFERSIQNNTVLPSSCFCECGYELYEEQMPFPIFSEAPCAI